MIREPEVHTRLPGERAAATARALTRARRGYRLLAGFYIACAIALGVIGWFARGLAGWAALAGLGSGCVLLTAVSAANRRARRPLRANWPDLARVSTPRAVQPDSCGAGACYVLALAVLAAMTGIIVTFSGAAAATGATQVMIVSCTGGDHGQEEACPAHWTSDGISYHGSVTWASPVDVGTAMAGRYVPDAPGVVYSAATPYLNGLSVMAGTLVLALGPFILLMSRRYLRDTRAPYLTALAEAASSSLQGQLRPRRRVCGAVPRDVPYGLPLPG